MSARTPTSIALIGLLLGSGCAGPDTTSPPADDGDVAAPEKGQIVSEFLMRVSPRERKVTISRIAPTKAKAPGLDPESIDDLSIVDDGVSGSGPGNTVEFVTNSVGVDGECPVGYQASTFCANVTLRHFYSRPLSNVFVQVVNVRAMDNTLLPDHGATNSDTSELGLSTTYGLWKYTAPAANTPGVLGQSPDNSGARDWVFANPDNADTYIKLRVVASLGYSAYIMDYSSQSFVDACSGGTSLGTTASTTQTLPFAFTLFGSTNTTVRYNKRGMITFGSVSGTSSGSNLSLPSGLAPKPGLFVFWDDIGYGSSGSAMCYKVLGSAPNRQYVVTWKNMNFVPVADQPASLTFSAFLNEGTDQIDVVYGSMTGPTSRAQGASATVGIQNATATTATFEYNTPDFGTGDAYSFVPIP